MVNLWAVSWPTTLCLLHLCAHRSSSSGSLRILPFKKNVYLQDKTIPFWGGGGGGSSLPKPAGCTSTFPAFLFQCFINRILQFKKIKFQWKRGGGWSVPLFSPLFLCVFLFLSLQNFALGFSEGFFFAFSGHDL